MWNSNDYEVDLRDFLGPGISTPADSGTLRILRKFRKAFPKIPVNSGTFSGMGKSTEE